FMFPVAIMFLVTGGLYTWGYKGGYDTTSYDISVPAGIPADLDQLTELVVSELQRREIAKPEGKAKLKKSGTSYKFEWTGSSRDVALEPTFEPLVFRLTVSETTWYRTFVQLHKAKGGKLFKYYAAALAVALFIILGSGLLMAMQIPRFRSLSLGTLAVGFLSFVLIVMAS
ncbi:MAG: hypothetical protein P8R04_03720, partial [Gammaproteobacteria bacterium]|nr:hypothetical protein [Gammaproteobacteria bacterium]